ncbi:methyltransferase domain-containing protein [Streptomyces gobiensis]|uniref:methyltransferase domain-containing protein n=1 Tax=Streptomyces gobiensis TaxID=2875706 RepID=UPI001E56C83A|nr:methyltransferase domain-containing protein [Streptomyces gobiensis]UGY91711.1 methyltransferase domain-containing protein [Streptomyces gobiensis]
MTSEGKGERSGLGRSLLGSGYLAPEWLPAFSAVPRSAFLPDVMWPFDMDTGKSVCVSRATDPEAWAAYAHANIPVVTQWDDGAHSGTAPGEAATSSASMPSVVFSMLRDLDVHPEDRVLEIGTGTGWNAGLLAHRVGASNVVTMDVDQDVSSRARAALGRFGMPVEVVTGDGALGHPEGAPYNRVIATCGLRRVPYAWVEQSSPDGVIVVPWGTDYSNQDAVARLTVQSENQRAEGHFTGPVEFMKLRAQRAEYLPHSAYAPNGVSDADKSSTAITECEFISGRFDAGQFAIGLRVPDCRRAVADKRDGVRPVWFYGLSDLSWAVVVFRDGQPEATVYQSGARRLWDEAEAAYRWWEGEGRPTYERFGLTVTPDSHTVWLDEPTHALIRLSARP